ncbi:hypothetical protein NP493_616g01055 [Ridgeia piscesae]|uniref:Dynactin subunit 2 n=1 Tax=Ridgeia piscesae TaxID=27915 RepID=A0AAD9NP24_RIDPI|nr:hypothetical protein NP493_616g01055 [Ridgeia piscesae]
MFKLSVLLLQAVDEPDIYETDELPEAEQALEGGELNDEGIEKVSVEASEAFTKFQGKSLDGSAIDFSDRIGKTKRTGYSVPRTEYEIVGEGCGVRETPQQKYQRLQHEMRELSEEVTQIKENIKSESSAAAMSPVALAKQVEYLQHQLSDLHLEKLLGSSGVVNLSDPQGALQKRLMTEIDGFKAPAAKQAGKKPEAAMSVGDSDHVTYQLFHRPEQAKFSNNAKLADIDQRLERIEVLLGNNPEKISTLTAETTNKTLMESVALLMSKLKLLDPTNLSDVELRLQVLGTRLEKLQKTQATVQDAGKQNKVTELYELVKKWDGVADSLPHIVDRLTALKDLHEQALQFSQAVTHLDMAQQQISSRLVNHGDMLKQVETTMSSNMATIKQNCAALEARLKTVKK